MALSTADKIPVMQAGQTNWYTVGEVAAFVAQVIRDSGATVPTGVSISSLPGDTEISGNEAMLTTEGKSLGLKDLKTHVLEGVTTGAAYFKKTSSGVSVCITE